MNNWLIALGAIWGISSIICLIYIHDTDSDGGADLAIWWKILMIILPTIPLGVIYYVLWALIKMSIRKPKSL
jgi:hypothetical protein